MPRATKIPTTTTSGTDGSRAPSVPNLSPERPGIEAVHNDTPSPDAWLIELCAELTAIYVESDRLFEVAQTALPGSVERRASDAFDDRMWDRREDLINTVFETPAVTPAGMAAKAAAVFHITDVAHSSNPDSRETWVARSLATDILKGVPA
jgi:hypothetical protein